MEFITFGPALLVYSTPSRRISASRFCEPCNDVQNLERNVENQDLSETRQSKYPHGFEAFVRLHCKKSERVVGSNEKAVAELRIFGRGVVVSLIVEVPVGFWSDDVMALAHRAPVFFRRSSRRR